MSKSANFFKAFNRIGRSGVLAQLTGNEVKALWAFFTHVDNKSLQAYPGLKILAEEIGIPKQEGRVGSAMMGLHEKGVLEMVKKGGGAKNTTVRKIAYTSKSDRVMNSSKSDRVKHEKTRRILPKNSSNPAQKLVEKRPRNYLVSTHSTSQQHQQHGTNGNGSHLNDAGGVVVAVAGGLDSEEEQRIKANSDFLKKREVQNPKRSNIARIPGLTVEVIDYAWNSLNGSKIRNRPGALVKMLEANAAEMIRDRVHAHAAAQAEQEWRVEERRVHGEFIESLTAAVRECRKIREADPKAYDGTVKEMRSRVASGMEFAKAVFHAEAERLVGDIPESVKSPESLWILAEEIGRAAMVARAFTAKTYEGQPWYDRFFIKTASPSMNAYA